MNPITRSGLAFILGFAALVASASDRTNELSAAALLAKENTSRPGVHVVARGYALGTPEAKTEFEGRSTGVGGVVFDPATTVFEIGSITKVFNGLLVAVAEEEGKLKANSSLGELLGSALEGASAEVKAVTLAQLITHTSCLPRLSQSVAASAADPYARATRAQLWRDLAALKLSKAAPCAADYSNFGVAVAGEVVSNVYGIPWTTLIEQKITGPLAMSATTVAVPQSGLAPPFIGSKAGVPWTFVAYAPAGALRSTATDMLKLAAAYAKPPEGVLGRALVRSQTVLASASGAKLAYASVLIGEPGRQTLTHDGGTGSYRAHFSIQPSTGDALVVLSSNGESGFSAFGTVLKSRYALAPADATQSAAAPASLAPYLGVYKVDDRVSFSFVEQGGKLWARVTNQLFNPYVPSGEHRFRFAPVGAEFSFDLKAGTVTLQQAGNRIPARRVEGAVPARLLASSDAEQLAAVYDAGNGMKFDVKTYPGGLTIQLTGQGPIPIYPGAAKDRFYLEAVKAEIGFTRNSSGAVTSLTLFQNGQEIQAKR